IALDRVGDRYPEWMNAPPYPNGYHRLRAEWERAGWENAGNASGEARAKVAVLRWRLHGLLSEATGERRHYYESALARPDIWEAPAPPVCPLARAGQLNARFSHLRAAVPAHPSDRAAARARAQAPEDPGDVASREALAADRRLLNRASPMAVPIEPWFAPAPKS